MNKRKIIITSFLGVCLITGLSACGTLAATPPKNSNPQNTSYQAQEISNTENKSDDFQTYERPGESTDYSIYEPYGLKYEKEKQYYTYNGDIVRFFNDPIAGASFTNFFTGTVDIEAERDKDNNLIGIKECSKEVYTQHTEKHNGVNSTGGIANNDTTQDGGTSSRQWLKDYADYNIIYNEQDGGWYYNNQKIKKPVSAYGIFRLSR